MKYFLILFLLLLNSVCFAQPRSNDDFLFGYIRNDIPYVIINNPTELSIIQGNIISKEVYPDDHYSKNTIELLTTKNIKIPDLPLYYGSKPPYGYEIAGNRNAFKKVFGFNLGDKLTIQIPDKKGAGLKSIIEIDKLIYLLKITL